MKKINHIHIIGAGGHAKVVIDAIESITTYKSISVYDSCLTRVGKKIFDKYEIQNQNFLDESSNIHVAIGNNKTRANLSKALSNSFNNLVSIIHPNAIVSPRAFIKEGCFVAAGAIIGPDSTIGYATIINHMAIIDHDCQIGNWVHVAPNATLGGGVKISDGVFVGAGAVILPEINVGEHAIVGAGAVVIRDVKPGDIVVGVPAKGKLQ